jgi:hypothetical protein
MDRPLLYLLCALCSIPPFSAFSFDTNPSLSITQSQGQAILSWPLSTTNWVLDRATDLTSGSWFRVPATAYQSNDLARYVTVSGLASSAFFRLRQLSPPLPGVAGHWYLDEGTGDSAEDESGRQTAMFFTNTTWATGRIGGAALWFNGEGAGDGSRAWVSNAGHRLLPVSGQPWSLSLWFNPDVLTTGWRTLVGGSDQGTNGWEVVLHTEGVGTNYLVFGGLGAPLSLNVTGRTLLLPGQWHELTVTHDGSKGAIYLDTRLLAQEVGPLSMQDGPIYFGGGMGTYDSFAGRLDDVRIYTNCLTQEQISLAGQWHFDENAGVVSADSGIKGHHGTLTDAAGWTPGREGSGVQLNLSRVLIRNDEYTVLPGSGGSFSISFWLRPNSLVDGRTGVMSCGTGAENGWQLAMDVNSPVTRVHFASTNCGGTLAVSAPLALTNGVWTKLDVTYNGGIATIYANGRKLQADSGAIRGSRAPLVIGAVPGLPAFDGVLDDLKIYSYERDAAEIGPVATTMWETAFINSTTNIVLRGQGPAGKLLTYSVWPLISPTNGNISGVTGSPIVSYASAGRKGPDAFAYTVSDGEFTSEPAMVALSVVEPHWLSPSRVPDGSKDGRSPGQAWPAGAASALNAIWKTNNYYDCFFYAPGEYETTGWKYLERPTVHPGCKHIGSGAGANPTIVRLVDAWDPAAEGLIFAPAHGRAFCDGFEVRQMVLDCNAANNPQYARGEPIWIRIPLVTNSLVGSVSLRWWHGSIPGAQGRPFRFGQATEFSLCTRQGSGDTWVTNCTSFTSTGGVDVIAVNARADEIVLQLDRRPADVDFYGLADIEVLGAEVSLPAATIPGGGQSQLNADFPIRAVADGNFGTSWASGPEGEVEIVVPLDPGTRVSQLNLHWNCVTKFGIGRFGAAASYLIRAHDEITGNDYDVPFVRHTRTADGQEINTFGTAVSTNTLVTDRLTIVLSAREFAVNYYSLREVTLQQGGVPIAVRLPTARNALFWSPERSILQAFDHNPGTQWASGTQGMIGALYAAGNNLKFTDLKVVGFGTKAGRECFPMFLSLGGGPAVHFGNIVVENCTFAEPATNNTDGVIALSLTALPPHTVTNAIIRGCAVTGLKRHFNASVGFCAVDIRDSLVSDCGGGVYFEPFPSDGDDLGPVLIRSNRFINVDHGVHVLSHPGGQFDSITCLGNEIVLTGAGGWGISSCDVCGVGPSGSITNVTALNNIIRYADWQPRPGSQEGGFLYSDIQHAVIGNNIIALGTANTFRVRECPAGVIIPPLPTEDCEGHVTLPPFGTGYPPCLDILRPGYRRAWFNNRGAAGPLLDVRFWNRGVEGLFSQQQWPE